MCLIKQKFKRVCYLRPEKNFPIDYVIRNNLCTHIIIAFVSIDNNSNISYDNNFVEFVQYCKQIINFYHSNIKLMFSIGGGGVGGWKMASSTEIYRKNFVNSIIKFLKNYHLDGVDIDWEFPSWPKSIYNLNEKNDFIKLLQEIRNNFNNELYRIGKKYLLSIAVAAQFMVIKTSYKKPQQINELIDFLNLMTYDYYIYKWYWPFIGHNSPLFVNNYFNYLFKNIQKTFSIQWSANYWQKLGINKDKIIVGLPTYGKRYILLFKKFNFPGSIAIMGKNDMSFNEVCDFLKHNDTIQKYDDVAQSPYAYNKREWISFENIKSIREKSKWILMNNFGGIMIFSLNADDYQQNCLSSLLSSMNPILFPLHIAIRDTVINY